MTVILTASLGGYDVLRDQPPAHDFDYVAYSDHQIASATWDVKHANVMSTGRRDAKYFKTIAHHRYHKMYEYSVWIDANIVLKDIDWLRRSIENLRNLDYGLALFPHPHRQCIYEEAQVSMGMEKYQSQPIMEQILSYRTENHPIDWGLWACGIIIRRNDRLTNHLMSCWMHEIDRWSDQDQISLPFLLRRFGIEPMPLEGGLYDNPAFDILPHGG